MGKMGRCDFKELTKLKEEIQKMSNQKEIDIFMESCVKELAARLLAKVVKRTPVGQYKADTGMVGGTLRRGWTTENEKTAMYSALFGGGEGGSASTGTQKNVYGKGAVGENVKGYTNSFNVSRTGNGYSIEIVNPVSYASYVEYGHRTANHEGWVNGQFMLTISEKEIKESSPTILENKLRKFMKECFNA